MTRRPKSSRYDGDIERGIGVACVEPQVPEYEFGASSMTITEFLASEWPEHLRRFSRRRGGDLALYTDRRVQPSFLLVGVDSCGGSTERRITAADFERRAHAVMYVSVVIDQLLTEAHADALAMRATMPADN